jgi:hypothetical protein
MEKVIKKWELILLQDSCRDITYGRKVLEEMLTDMKMAVKNYSIRTRIYRYGPFF